MAVKPAEERRLYLQIADKLRALIDEKGLAPNDRLPSERELATLLGVSRPSIREALVALELEGRVEIRMGSGVYIGASTAQKPSAASVDHGESPLEIMTARRVIEGAIASSVAAFGKPRELKALREIYESMASDVAQNRIPTAADRAFHIAIAQMSGNEVLVRTVAGLFDERHSPLSSTLRGHFEGEETWQAALAEHHDILEALEAKDAIQAQATMQRHLTASYERLMTRRQR